MGEFIDISILETLIGCSTVITLLTQIFKKFLPEKVDTKWLALVFSIVIGLLRMAYLGQFSAGLEGIATGTLNIFVILASAIGIYEVGSAVLTDTSDTSNTDE